MRTAKVERKTNETEIFVELNLDGSGKAEIDTGIGFFDHMLTQIAVHGLIDLTLRAKGDLHIDPHHTVEDCGLVLGTAFSQALGKKEGIFRTASATVPMDEALGQVVVDFSGRPYAVLKTSWTAPMVGGLPTSLLEHFFESFASASDSNLHLIVHYGKDNHHIAEALFKAMARAVARAVQIDPAPERQDSQLKGDAMTIAVINYGLGNLHSVQKAAAFVGGQTVVTARPREILGADKVILPGVGAFADGMKGLDASGLVAVVREVAASGKPLLGICLGMQLLFEESDEQGHHQGLGLLPGKVILFEKSDFKVPQIGWNQVELVKPSPLMAGIRDGNFFYFNHSYYCLPEKSEDILTSTDYGIRFSSSVARGNIYGVQFHPEKSQKTGLQILKNFVELSDE